MFRSSLPLKSQKGLRRPVRQNLVDEKKATPVVASFQIFSENVSEVYLTPLGLETLLGDKLT